MVKIPEDFDAEFGTMFSDREKLAAEVKACKSLEDLVAFLHSHPNIPGQTKQLTTEFMQRILKGVTSPVDVLGQTSKQNKARIQIMRLALGYFTRSFGVRRSAAELLGAADYFEPEFLDETVGFNEQGNQTMH